MKILIDSREQKPLEFDFPYVEEIRVEKLEVGDYTVEYNDGYRPPVIFEKKSIPDLYGTLGKGHKRFKKEIAKAKDMNIKLILIIEGTLSKVLKGYEHSTLSGISIVRTVFSLWLRYGLTPVFCKDRAEMQTFIYNYYTSIGRLKGRKGLTKSS